MGKFDYVPEVLKQLGVKVLFHKVQQKPGRPFWFGNNKKGKLVFALPGNPVSTQICAYRYVIPRLKEALGVPEKQKFAIVNHDFETKTSLTYFLPVKIVLDSSAKINAAPVYISGSGDFTALARADGFVELPPGPQKFDKGFVAKLFTWE